MRVQSILASIICAGLVSVGLAKPLPRAAGIARRGQQNVRRGLFQQAARRVNTKAKRTSNAPTSELVSRALEKRVDYVAQFGSACTPGAAGDAFCASRTNNPGLPKGGPDATTYWCEAKSGYCRSACKDGYILTQSTTGVNLCYKQSPCSAAANAKCNARNSNSLSLGSRGRFVCNAGTYSGVYSERCLAVCYAPYIRVNPNGRNMCIPGPSSNLACGSCPSGYNGEAPTCVNGQCSIVCTSGTPTGPVGSQYCA